MFSPFTNLEMVKNNLTAVIEVVVIDALSESLILNFKCQNQS